MITHLLAVDGGGTKTALRLTPLEPLTADPFFTLTLGPSSLTQQGKQAIELIQHAIAACLEQHRLQAEQVSIVVGVAGAGNLELKQQLQLALTNYPYCQITTDAHISLLGANQGQPTNVIAIGTGSVASQLSHDEEVKIFGGWGFPIGDQGGGAWLGQQSIRALIHTLEGAPPSPLTRHLKHNIGDSRAEVITWLKRATATEFAQLAPDVIRLAEQSCPDSLAILSEGCRYIDRLIAKCCENNDLDIAFLGSLGAYYQSRLGNPWQPRVIQPKGDALDGAIWLAKQRVENNNE
ncbi:N-acetylglucosamine kinase [Vibrio tubiashii]|uniref:N-acetylglucosamine kinase n=1 Tax=Vibrio tubiashii TaxID=29498 RepID=A0AAE5GUH6_9VIBR|nr:BadF/BadG/BcrA/BcrD ATPase family protein [Vibrio tubiashii]NOI83471.1 N-acetylglucosamine kinase [Vibrio tubiashii]